MKSGAKIGKGCVLSFGVVVGANVVLPPYTRLTLSNAKVGNEVKLSVVNDLAIERGRLSFIPEFDLLLVKVSMCSRFCFLILFLFTPP